MTKDASVGGIIGELVSLIGDARRDIALYTLLIGGLTAAGVLAGLTEATTATFRYGFQIDGGGTPASALFELLAAVASVVGTYLLLTRLLAVRGRLWTGGGRFWPYLGMSILSVVAAAIGLVLLIVPGIILLVRWSAASGFVVGAGESVTGSLSASWNATKGHGWAIFFSAVVVLLSVAVLSSVTGTLVGFAGAFAVNVVSAFVEAATEAVLAALGIAVYCRVQDHVDVREVFA